jgi:hypothetical protein
MEKTPFAGVTILEPGEGLDSDNGAFIDRDRLTIDHFLKLGAKLHRHNGEAGLLNPTIPASGAVVASGGTIASDLTISLGYTIEDAQGGETMLSPLAVVSTGSQMDIPIAAPSAAVEYTGGSLLVNQYYYAVTWTDGDGGETPAGPAVAAERAPGFASGRVKLTNLTYGMAAAGAVEWRLFRAIGGGTYDLLTTGGIGTDSFVDDGTTSVDCDTHPPTDSQNTTKKVNTLLVTLPKADANMSRATNINLYGSLTGEFGEASSLGQYPVASAGATVAFSALNFNDATPPDVNLSIGGAALIDPDTELLDWHWRRPVAASALLGSGTLGDVKLVTGTGQLYGILAPSASAAGPKEWVPLASAQAQALTASANGGQVTPVTKLTLIASGGARVTMANAGGGEAQATIFAPSLRASAASANPGVVSNVETLTFVGSAGASATVQQLGTGVAQITLVAGGGGSSLAVFGSGSAAAGAETPVATKLELIGSGGVNIKESSPGGGVAKAVVEGLSATLADGGMGVMVLTTAQKGAARPKAWKQVTWYCKEKPTNMAEFDIWVEEGP